MDKPNRKVFDVSIRIAGNTMIPCIQAIAAKGYTITHYFLGTFPGDYDHPQWDAEKDNCRFSASSPEQLLGLIAMWEVRGEDWRIKEHESELYDQLVASAAIIDNDGEIVDI